MSAATRQLPERTNRGKRTKELIGEEKEIDDAFWKTNGIYVDMVDDEDYEVEPEKEDKFDEDFWESESESDTGEQDCEPNESKPKKPAKSEPKKQRKPARRLKIGAQLSQKELLEEAAGTEMWNQYRLTQMMKFEEAKVQRFGNVGRRLTGPILTTIDTVRSGKRKVFLRYSPESPITPLPKPVKPETTGKYRDPKTGQPYSTIEEFRKLRSAFIAQQESELQARVKSLKESLAKKREALEQYDAKYGCKER